MHAHDGLIHSWMDRWTHRWTDGSQHWRTCSLGLREQTVGSLELSTTSGITQAGESCLTQGHIPSWVAHYLIMQSSAGIKTCRVGPIWDNSEGHSNSSNPHGVPVAGAVLQPELLLSCFLPPSLPLQMLVSRRLLFCLPLMLIHF